MSDEREDRRLLTSGTFVLMSMAALVAGAFCFGLEVGGAALVFVGAFFGVCAAGSRR